MNTRRQIIVIVALCTLITASGCGFGQFLPAQTPAVPTGQFKCSIPIALQGTNDIVILSFTITPDHKIGDWSIFDFGTRSVSIGDAIGQSSLIGNAVTFALTDPSGTNITYKINGTIESAHKMTGDYNFDYGSSYGVAADKFDCDLTPPTVQTTPTP